MVACVVANVVVSGAMVVVGSSVTGVNGGTTFREGTENEFCLFLEPKSEKAFDIEISNNSETQRNRSRSMKSALTFI